MQSTRLHTLKGALLDYKHQKLQVDILFIKPNGWLHSKQYLFQEVNSSECLLLTACLLTLFPSWKTPQILSHTLPKLTHSHTHLKVGLSIEAGCGDVTGAVCTVWWQQYKVGWECLIFSHTDNVPHLDRQAETHK